MASAYEYESFKVSFPAEYVALVEIDRPKKMNSFTDAMFHALGAIFKRLSTDPDVRAIVLSAAGDRAFSTGLDVQAAAQGNITKEFADVARKANNLRRFILDWQDCITAIEKCEKPVIIVYHAYSFGLAVDIGTAADIRIATSDVQFSVKEVDIGLAADIGTLSRLPKVVGNSSWVKDVCLTARIFGGEEALKAGFVSDVLPSKDAAVRFALEKAKLIAGKSPVAVLGTKDILNYSRDRTTEDGLRYTSVWNAAMVQSQDLTSAMLSGLQKKKPTFEKL